MRAKKLPAENTPDISETELHTIQASLVIRLRLVMQMCWWKGITMQRRALRHLREFISGSVQDRGVVFLGTAWRLACRASPNDKV